MFFHVSVRCFYGVRTAFRRVMPETLTFLPQNMSRAKKTVSGLNDALEMCDMTFVRVSGFVQMDLI